MDRPKKSSEKTTTSKAPIVEASPPISVSEAFIANLLCGLGLALAYCVANSVYTIDLVTDPSLTLFFIWIIELPIVILLYSRYRKNPQQCTYLRAVGRGILGVPVGALLNSLGAIALGAPVTFQYLPKTVNWSLMMSLFTIVPASCVLGSSWADWQRIFAQTKPNGSIEYLICLQAHGAVIGGWFGAWPMPLDWERPWQAPMSPKDNSFLKAIMVDDMVKDNGTEGNVSIDETERMVAHHGDIQRWQHEWPISVSYGALAGYLVTLVASLGFVLADHRLLQHVKKD